MYQIVCNNLSLGYEGKIVAGNITFSVSGGDYLCILGENGSGKSTLMRALLYLKAPYSGTIEYGDGIKPSEIGYLPQQSTLQRDFPASVYEVVLSGCVSHMGSRPFYTGAEKALADEKLERLGISHLKKKVYRNLSGGQQQRVLLARALCATRKMLLLDEPVSGLDPSACAEMYGIIDELNRNDGITVIMISHDIPSALRYATHILHIGSEPAFFGTREEYIASGIAGNLMQNNGTDGEKR